MLLPLLELSLALAAVAGDQNEGTGAAGLGAAPLPPAAAPQQPDPSGAAGGSLCYRRGRVELSKCDRTREPWWTVYTKTPQAQGPTQWTKHAGVNCLSPRVPGPDPFSRAISLAGCQAACAEDTDCFAIVVPTPGVPNPSPPPGPGGKPAGGGCNGVDLPRPNPKQIYGPAQLDAATVSGWLARMRQMRSECQKSIGFNASVYDLPGLKWAQTAYLSPQMHVFDRYFYNASLGNGTDGRGYTVQRWLADLNSRYGGIDKALLWPTYTNLGIDDRNQFDLTRSVPGGTRGLRAVVKQLHAAGVHVMWAYNPWDKATSGAGQDETKMAELIRDTDGDGFNGDCMSTIPETFFEDARRIAGKPIAMEGEGGLGALKSLNWQTLGWCEGCNADESNSIDGLDIPDVDRVKWITGSRSMSHWSDRYAGSPESRDQFGGLYSPLWSGNMSEGVSKISEIQTIWFNAVGYETFENIWGTWNGMIERDGEALRRVGLLLRYFGARGFFTSPDWEPHTTEVLQMQHGVFGSSWPSSSGEEVVWTLVNRKMSARSGAQLLPRSRAAGMRFYDCYRGVELNADPKGSLSFVIEGGGFGCVLATKNASKPAVPTGVEPRGAVQLRPASLDELLGLMSALTARGLESFSGAWTYAQQQMVPIAPTPLRPLHNATKGEEVYVPGSIFHFDAAGVEVESAAGSGCDVQYPWEDHPGRRHSHTLQLGAMYVDRFPVTNEKYHRFLQESRYAPADRGRWLERNFGADGKPKPGWAKRPVTFVSLEDARSYCAFRHKRLPHSFEWQYFSQGNDERLYPWGEADDLNRTSPPRHGSNDTGPEEVGLHPDGASVFGVEDLVRQVWEYTDEFRGPHTANVILRGGSSWSVHKGSRWYFRGTYDLKTFNTYHLMSGSYERASTVGFRCVADAQDDCGTGGQLCIQQAPKISSADGSISSELTVAPISGGASGLVFSGATNGFQVSAPGPVSGNATLLLRVRSVLGARGNLTAAVARYTKSLRIRDAATSLSITYRGGPLRLDYRNEKGSVCSNRRLCLLAVAPTCPARAPMMRCVTDLSAGAIDWMHWGSVNISAVWSNNPSAKSMAAITQRKAGGSSGITARLLMPGCTTDACHANTSDLKTWGSQGWPSDGARYSWNDGAPPNKASGPGARSGAYSYLGTFQLQVPASTAPATARKLRLYTALFNFAKQEISPENWVNSATLQVHSPGQPTLNRTITHMDGNNNDAVSTAFEIVFVGELVVTYSLDPASKACPQCGWVSMQAAALEEHSGDVVGGVELISAQLLKTDDIGSRTALSSPFAPHPLPPSTSPSPFFEGWFTRVVAPKDDLSFSVIVASFRPAHAPGVTQVWTALLLDRGGKVTTVQRFLDPERLRLTVDGGNVSSPPRLGTPARFRWSWTPGPNDSEQDNGTLVVEDDTARLDFTFRGHGRTIRVQADLSHRVPWDRAAPNSAGPEGWLAGAEGLLPTHYFVQSLASRASFELTTSSSEHRSVQRETGAGFGHQEANWGGTFPTAWIWAEGISADGTAQLLLTAGEFDIAGITTQQAIVAVRTPTRSYTFRNIDLDKVVSKPSPCGLLPSFSLEATGHAETTRVVIEITAPRGTFSKPLEAPSHSGFSAKPGSVESYSAEAHVTIFTRRSKAEAWARAEELAVRQTALEFGGAYIRGCVNATANH